MAYGIISVETGLRSLSKSMARSLCRYIYNLNNILYFICNIYNFNQCWDINYMSDDVFKIVLTFTIIFLPQFNIIYSIILGKLRFAKSWP